MNKKICLILLLIVIVILLIILIKKDKDNKELECIGEETLVMTNARVKYNFSSINEYVSSQKMFVKMYGDDLTLLENYKNIIKENKECSNVVLEDLVLSYECDYDLNNNQYYESLRKNDKISISDLKKYFEDNNFVCNYKWLSGDLLWKKIKKRRLYRF